MPHQDALMLKERGARRFNGYDKLMVIYGFISIQRNNIRQLIASAYILLFIKAKCTQRTKLLMKRQQAASNSLKQISHYII